MVTQARGRLRAKEARTASGGTRLPSLRSTWRRLHLGLAFCVGGAFAFLGVTGSFLVFYKEIDAFLNPELLTRQSEVREDLPLVDLAELVRKEFGDIQRIDLAGGSNDVHRMRVVPRTDPSVHLEVMVDPAGGGVLGSRPWREHFVSLVYDLHYTLLAGRTGRDIVGYLGAALFASIASGVYLWWPRQGGFAKAFRVKWRANWFRRFFDLHKSVGVSAALLLSTSAFSGIAMQFPETTRTAVEVFLPETGDSHIEPGSRALRTEAAGLEIAIARARDFVPDGRVRRILLPNSLSNHYRVYLRRPGEMQRSGGLNLVQVDAATGAVVRVRLARNFSAADWVMAWQFPLHNGEAAGLPGRWLVFCLGFTPLVLWITGIGLWWKKHQTRKRRKAI